MIADIAQALFYIVVFPGFIFLSVIGLFAEWVDRILSARMQNRQGPPWFQPTADFIKLISKEDIVPENADQGIFKLMPIVALIAVVTAFLYIPVWKTSALFSFTGDIIVILYLLTIPTLSFFLGGWYSTSLYSSIGAVRTITQLFAYEVPLFLSILSVGLLADSWSLKDMTAFYIAHPLYMLFNVIGFCVALISLLGKLEKVPFDIPEAETEIVAGTFTEYSGRLLGIFRMAIDIEAIVGAALVAAVFLPFGLNLPPLAAFGLFIAKVFGIIAVMALLRTLFARLRIDQMMDFCWKIMAPLALVQILANIIIKGVLLK